MRLSIIAILSGSFFAETCLADPGEGRIFWTDKDDFQLESARLDGSDRVTLLSGLADPRGIAVDSAAGKIYWASHEVNGSIFSADCDGSDVATFIDGLIEPADIALDLENRLIYWVEEASSGVGTIRRASLDGGAAELVLGGLTRPYYLEVDVAAGFVYWTDFNNSVIHRATTEGANSINFITGQTRVRDIAVSDGIIYWCDRNSNQIRSRALDGMGAGTVLFSGGADRVDRPHGLVLDPETQQMFWTDTEIPQVNSAAMDGSGSVTTLVSTSLNGAWGIALSKPVVAPYDSWLAENFTSVQLADPSLEASVWGELADPDQDGRANLLEYAQATNPLEASQDPLALRGEVEDSFFKVIIRMRKGDASVNSGIESSLSLTGDSWETGDFTEMSPRVDDAMNPGYEFVTYRAALGEERRFARLIVAR
ncbi:hypothetical protein N9Z95_03705 [Akkermansiaceae bacterium]|nr:hypothetical protein [Akkermansiaceae bacterium]